MKKLIALAFVGAFALALVSCGGGAKSEDKADSVVTTAPDTTMAPADTTKMDSTAAH
jgi:hypothetical protein